MHKLPYLDNRSLLTVPPCRQSAHQHVHCSRTMVTDFNDHPALQLDFIYISAEMLLAGNIPEHDSTPLLGWDSESRPAAASSLAAVHWSQLLCWRCISIFQGLHRTSIAPSEVCLSSRVHVTVGGMYTGTSDPDIVYSRYRLNTSSRYFLGCALFVWCSDSSACLRSVRQLLWCRWLA